MGDSGEFPMMSYNNNPFDANALDIWNPSMSAGPVQRRLNQLRNEAVRPLAPLMTADLIESENDFHVHVDLPGVENLDISTENNELIISADRKVMHEVDSDILHSVERSYGKVKRRIPIPEQADADRASAKFEHGVLTVTFPKKEGTPARRKKINIS